MHQPPRLTPFEDQVTQLVKAPASPKMTQALRFVSLRWRLILPLFSVLLVLLTIGAYGIAYTLSAGYDDRETTDLLLTIEEMNGQVMRFSRHHEGEIMRIMATAGVRENIAAQNGVVLHALIEPSAVLAGLDTVLVTNKAGIEIVGLQRVNKNDEGGDYAVSDQTNLQQVSVIQRALQSGVVSSGFVRSAQGVIVLTAVPVYSPADEMMGVVAVGTRLDLVLVDIQAGARAEVGLFDGEGSLLRTTFADEAVNQLRLDVAVVQQTLQSADQVPMERQIVDGKRYLIGYTPFYLQNEPLGVLAIYQPSGAAFATAIARQMLSLLAAIVVALTTIIAYLFTARLVMRVEQIRSTVEALMDGASGTRTGLKANSEIGRLAKTIDRYAEGVETRDDNLIAVLRRQHRENAHLNAILESLPDGLIVMDSDGHVLLMNTAARRLIGGMRTLRSATFTHLTAAVTDTLGPALAPGLYSLGDPTRILHQEHMLQAQAAAVIAVTGKKLGTVISLRDITDEVRQEQVRDNLIEKLMQDVQTPSEHIAQEAALKAVINARTAAEGDPLLQFARDIARNARSLQRLITELREVNALNVHEIARVQSAIPLADLVQNIAAQWQPTAEAARIALEVELPKTESFVLGDERRLRWAFGNIVDNAIKYSPAGAKVKISAREHQGEGFVSITDYGAGISPEDLPHVFQRFYRGKPVLPDGQVITIPGTGQGLYLAQNVIRAHGGALDLKSRPGIGTTIKVKLPLTSPYTLEMSSPVQAKVENDSLPLREKVIMEHKPNAKRE